MRRVETSGMDSRGEFAGGDALARRAGSHLALLDGALVRRIRADLAPPRRPVTVVWCEDEPTICDVMQRLWECAGCAPSWRPHPEDELHFASTGEEALELVRRHQPDLFMSDERHPGHLPGIKLFEMLRSEPGMSLGYYTGCSVLHAGDELGEKARRIGVDIIVEKPGSPFDMLELLSPVVERHRRSPRRDAAAAAPVPRIGDQPSQ